MYFLTWASSLFESSNSQINWHIAYWHIGTGIFYVACILNDHQCSKLLLLLFLPVFLQAQDTTQCYDSTKGLKSYPGFFHFYWNENTGKMFLEINQLDTRIYYIILHYLQDWDQMI
jgi:hypothetical protein